MASRNIFKTCFYALGAGFGFGAGMVIRLSVPRASEMLILLFEKLGFEWNDILLYVLDPEDTYHVHKPVKKKKKSTARGSKRTPALSASRRTPRQVVIS